MWLSKKTFPFFLLLLSSYFGGFFLIENLANNKSHSIENSSELIAIKSCHDGDTCRTISGERIRFACIDAPELDQPYGQASRDHLRSLVGGKTIRIERKGTDRYNRTIGALYINNKLVQLEQIKAGTAWANERFKRDCPDWKSIESEFNKAKGNRIGLFNTTTAIEPWRWRKIRR